jgi:AcrR family transcriptional regulator
MTTNRREQDMERTRQLILDAAREEFIASGYEATSVRQVARRAGFSHGTIYLHFRDKDDLLFQVSEDEFARLLSQLRALPRSQDPIQRLIGALRAFGTYGLDHPHQYQLMMGHRPHTFSETDSPRFGPMAEQVSSFLGDLMREASRRSFVMGATPKLDHLTLLATVHGIVDMFLLKLVDRETAERAIDHSILLILSALTGGSCVIGAPELEVVTQRGV